MDSTVLDKEKFDSLNELAGIQTEIANGRAVLTELKTQTESYLQEREQEAIRRIEAVLVNSETVLRAIGDNHDALKKYHSEVKAMAQDLQAILLLFKEVRAKQVEVTALEHRKLEEKAEQLERVETELKVKRSNIEAETLANDADRQWIADEKRRLIDERGLLERTAARLKEGKL